MVGGAVGAAGGSRAPDARLGVFRVGQDRLAVVYLDASREDELREDTRLILAAQNGACTFARSAPNTFMGDTAVQVALRPGPDGPESLTLDVSAKLRPEHLTYAFVARGAVPRPDAEAFWATFRRSNDYVLSVALRGQPDFDRVYVVKYYIDNTVALG